MPASASAGRRISFQQRYCASTSLPAWSWISSSASRGCHAVGQQRRAELQRGGARWRRGSRRIRRGWCRKCTGSAGAPAAARCGPRACASTRKLNSSCDSSRLRYSEVAQSLGGRSASRAVGAVVHASGMGADPVSGCRADTRVRGRNGRRRCCRCPTSLSISRPRLMQVQHVLDDRQAQAGAAAFARAAGGHAVEAFGDARQVLGRNAVAGVAAPPGAAPPSRVAFEARW